MKVIANRRVKTYMKVDGKKVKLAGVTCVADGCDRPAVTKLLCPKHYHRLMKNGDPNKTRISGRGVIQKWVDENLPQADNDACLLWPFGKTSRGYAVWGTKPAHRAICLLMHGEPPTPERTQVAHSCDNRLCVNPHHLRWASHEENMEDMVVRQRARQGVQHRTAKLDDEAVRIIRATPRGYGVTKALSERFGVATGTICHVWAGKGWKAVGVAK